MFLLQRVCRSAVIKNPSLRANMKSLLVIFIFFRLAQTVEQIIENLEEESTEKESPESTATYAQW